MHKNGVDLTKVPEMLHVIRTPLPYVSKMSRMSSLLKLYPDYSEDVFPLRKPDNIPTGRSFIT